MFSLLTKWDYATSPVLERVDPSEHVMMICPNATPGQVAALTLSRADHLRRVSELVASSDDEAVTPKMISDTLAPLIEGVYLLALELDSRLNGDQQALPAEPSRDELGGDDAEG